MEIKLFEYENIVVNKRKIVYTLFRIPLIFCYFCASKGIKLFDFAHSK